MEGRRGGHRTNVDATKNRLRDASVLRALYGSPDVACSIANRSMLPEVRVLARSFRAQHPSIPFIVLLADDVPDDPDVEPFHILSIDAAGISTELRFQARMQQLSYLATPFLLRTLLGSGARRVLFFKQETLICSSARRLYDQLHQDPILLAPHLVSPRTGPDALEVERMVLRTGAFNVGVLGVANDARAREFLAWWCVRVTHDSALAVERGVHYEQRWLTLVPTLFDGVRIDRDAGTNVGHWQMPDTVVEMDGSGVPHADGRPIVALRFSGFDGDRPTRMTRYSERLDRLPLGDMQHMIETYAELLVEQGHHRRDDRYAYAAFDDGVQITDEHRDLHAGLLMHARTAFGDPFRTGSASFAAWAEAAFA